MDERERKLKLVEYMNEIMKLFKHNKCDYELKYTDAPNDRSHVTLYRNGILLKAQDTSFDSVSAMLKDIMKLLTSTII